MAVPDQRVAEPPGHTPNLVALHETIAERLAERGHWKAAYEHARRALDMIAAEGAEAREQAIRDALTASYNRRYLDQRLLALAAGTAGLAVALVDLDRFKRVNDTFGHQVGDRVLQRVVDLLQDGLPDAAFCARYGGEEFVLVLPGVTAAAAVLLAESARARVERFPWDGIARDLRVTVSIGIDHEPLTETHPETRLRRADSLLYAAKRSGRNAVAYRLDGQTRLAGPAEARRLADRSDRLPQNAVAMPQVD